MRYFATFMIGIALFIVSILPGAQSDDMPVYLLLSFGLPALWRHGPWRRPPKPQGATPAASGVGSIIGQLVKWGLIAFLLYWLFILVFIALVAPNVR